jgi:hypothetical protein
MPGAKLHSGAAALAEAGDETSEFEKASS